MEETLKKPSLGLLIPEFKAQSDQVALTYGRPGQRVQYLRGTTWGKTPEQLRKQIVDSINPATGKSLGQEIIDNLTRPLTAAESDMSEKKMDVGPAFYTDTEENLHKLFLEKRYTDFLPVVLPTEERVKAMLAQTSHEPEAVLARMNPGSVAGENWTYRVRHAAIAAVMAGCDPKYFPVVLAIGSTGTTSVNISDNGFMMGAVINGKIRDEIGLNYDVGAVGPYAHANTTIGRAWSLLSINGGNSGKVGTTYMGTVGNSDNLVNIIIAENEENSPWEPFAMRRGFNKDENVVTLFNGWGILSARNWAITDWSNTPDYAKNIQDIYRMQNASMYGTFAVLSPPVAQVIYDAGYDTVEKLTTFVTQRDANAKPAGSMGTGFGAPGGAPGAGPGGPGGGAPKAGGAGGAAGAKPKAGGFGGGGFGGGSNFNVVVTGASNNMYWMIGGMSPGRSVQIDPWR